MDLRTQLKKFYLYVETVHDDGDWSPDNVVDKYLQSQHGGKPIVSGSLPDDLMYRLYSSDLCSAEQVDENEGEDDYGSYWLNDVTVEDVVAWLCTTVGGNDR